MLDIILYLYILQIFLNEINFFTPIFLNLFVLLYNIKL